ncbi:unnamed protein product [Ranitomeya imitator]|uniref:Reverse transcriptase domain-containing protein n=1 Tax=Ranitomeya imitator TaxID=111125 RepID=A0ABN9L029_9NEOB|nr:unnamed protein product [Ranitomeya imitator]
MRKHSAGDRQRKVRGTLPTMDYKSRGTNWLTHLSTIFGNNSDKTKEINDGIDVDVEENKIDFLDLQLSRGPTGQYPQNESNSLLHARSAHPRHTIKAIPKGQFIRARRICDSEEEFENQARDLTQRLFRRGYMPDDVERGYQQAKDRSRDSLLHYQTPEKEEPQLRMITNYHSRWRDMGDIMNRHWPILKEDPELSKLVEGTPRIVVRRSKTIGLTSRQLRVRILEHIKDIRAARLIGFEDLHREEVAKLKTIPSHYREFHPTGTIEMQWFFFGILIDLKDLELEDHFSLLKMVLMFDRNVYFAGLLLKVQKSDRRDNPSGSNSFLGQRRRRQPQRRRGPGGVNERRDADFYRVTRSQTSPVTTSDTSRSLISSHSLGLRNKSMYRPPRSSHAVEAFIGFIEQSFSKLRQDIEAHKLHTSTNLSAPDFQALQTLRNDKDIIIKPADKGGAIVVMNKSDYTKEIHRQLHDDTVYRLLPADPTTMIRNFIKETLDPYVEKGVIDGKTREYLTKDFPIIPVFYILPKIHKSLEHPPGHPIVASTESILSPLAIFLEKILTPLIRTLPSFLLDTGDFLRQLRNLDSLPADLLLVSLDVRDLYTSIPHTRGILSVRHLLTNSLLHPDFLQKIFMFEDQFFLQTKGTAMGSNVAPPYANSYMALFEEEIVYPDPLFQAYCPFWRRYIDDVFCLWTGTPQTLDLFFHTLNTAWPGLTFTMTSNTEKVSFLDTLIFRDELGTLKTDLYTKPTDRNSLLHFNSLHPTATKR